MASSAIARSINNSPFYGIRKATAFLMKKVHLRPVKKVKFTFDPYMESSASVRDVATVLHFPEVLETNMAAVLKFDIKSDRTEPSMEVEFNDGHKLLMQTTHLNKLEILDYFYEFVDNKDPKKDEPAEVVTKSAKVMGRKR